jgi:hypothetical protein
MGAVQGNECGVDFGSRATTRCRVIERVRRASERWLRIDDDPNRRRRNGYEDPFRRRFVRERRRENVALGVLAAVQIVILTLVYFIVRGGY